MRRSPSASVEAFVTLQTAGAVDSGVAGSMATVGVVGAEFCTVVDAVTGVELSVPSVATTEATTVWPFLNDVLPSEGQLPAATPSTVQLTVTDTLSPSASVTL